MITHLLFKGLNSFNIGSSMFRKILAVIIAVLIFALVFLAVKFTKVEVPNFNRNLIMLAVVDISAFGLVMWKFGCPMEKCCEEKEKEDVEAKVEAVVKEGEVAEEKESASNKTKEVEDNGDDKDDKDDGDDEDDEDDMEEEAGNEVEDEAGDEDKEDKEESK